MLELWFNGIKRFEMSSIAFGLKLTLSFACGEKHIASDKTC